MIIIGCDITLHCECRRDGVWHNCDNFEWNEKTKTYEFVSIYSWRNYDLFGILAGVRSNEFDSIDDPRGLPKDISLKTKEMADEWKDSGHSYSWLTLRELLAWKFKQKKKWKKYKKHYEVVHSTTDGTYLVDNEGNMVYKRDHKMLDRLIRLMKDKMDDHIFCFDEDDYWMKGDDFRIVFWFDS